MDVFRGYGQYDTAAIRAFRIVLSKYHAGEIFIASRRRVKLFGFRFPGAGRSYRLRSWVVGRQLLYVSYDVFHLPATSGGDGPATPGTAEEPPLRINWGAPKSIEILSVHLRAES